MEIIVLFFLLVVLVFVATASVWLSASALGVLAAPFVWFYKASRKNAPFELKYQFWIVTTLCGLCALAWILVFIKYY
ncbi:MAG: hypothetical protein K2Q03_03525 [Sphingobacteriaceae bacterium]|nr:hypothetical protein [Sphingobacteriaceae bacterium]